MSADTIVAACFGLAGMAGAYWEGRRRGRSTEMGIAVDTVELLQAQVEVLNEHVREKDDALKDLRARVEILESMVTQRAEVEEVRLEVQGVRGVVDRIATKVGA